MDTYDAHQVEAKWQRVWDDAGAAHVGEPDPAKQKSYVVAMWPYPSGTLHMGHVLVYTVGDVLTRFRKRQGMEVLHPIGFDSFGLPAENAAIKEGLPPRETTERNIKTITDSMRRMGWAFDWSRLISAHEPTYYVWNQWLFLKLYEAGLAYRKGAPVKWCPQDQVVLANEQVHDGRCEYCGTEVIAKNLEQWFFRTTAYAQELIDELDGLEWAERLKTMQRNWIGRSDGAEIQFRIEELEQDVAVFTTRPDTLYGATFFVLAPEHPLVDGLAERSPNGDELRAYVGRAAVKRGEERAAAEEKTGVFTGFFATNPVNEARIPIWVADYVLMDYGTGAIMAVPAHDERDREFAETFDLPIVTVIDEDDKLVDSAQFTGLPADEGKRAIVAWLGERGRGRETISYRLRDWSFSRQRYWGSPIPIVYCETCGVVPVPYDDLPVLLPDIDDYRPRGVAPLESVESFINTECPQCGGPARREGETMDTFVDSSWYFLRYTDPHNSEAPFRKELADFWNPVDQYIGGVDHTTMHMIYARFFMKALNDLGLIGFREPFAAFFTNGWVNLGGTKMSKSKGNVIGPEEMLDAYGADVTRLNILHLGPATEDMEWTDEGAEGMVRFARRLYRLVSEVAASSAASAAAPPVNELSRKAHQTIVRVSDDLGRRQSFHTAISAVIELLNELSRSGAEDPAARFAAETAVSLIQPYAPHLAEELWQKLGHERLWESAWPVADQSQLQRDTFELVVQVNGKVRDRFEVDAGLGEEELVARAQASAKVQSHIDGAQVRKTIVVPRKLVNFVV
ncbi:MAG TPA: leucine--tRNA ligase [Gaiellaceae bacterium]